MGTVRDVSLLSGQELQSLACLQWHYDREYVIAVTGGAWQARRRNREGESVIVILTAESAVELGGEDPWRLCGDIKNSPSLPAPAWPGLFHLTR